MRKTHVAIASVGEGKWNRDLFIGRELYGKTIGILGFGRVGKLLAKYALAFDMKVYANEISETNKISANKDVIFTNLQALLEVSDIFVVALPLNEGTKNIINESHFDKMAKRPWFVNTARGSIVNEEALLSALNKGSIKGACLDVLAGENAFSETGRFVNHPLVNYMNEHDNLIITPHIAGSSIEAMVKTAQFIGAKMESLLCLK